MLEPGPVRAAGVLLALVALGGTAVMALTRNHAQPYIAAHERDRLLSRLQARVPPRLYDNDPVADGVAMGGGGVVYRAYRDGVLVGAAFDVIARDGYGGLNRLLVGIGADGAIIGVRVVSHRETPGQGDGIERERSPWVLDFDGRSLANTPDALWTARRHDGDFDQLTGATITPSAVVRAVHR